VEGLTLERLSQFLEDYDPGLGSEILVISSVVPEEE